MFWAGPTFCLIIKILPLHIDRSHRLVFPVGWWQVGKEGYVYGEQTSPPYLTVEKWRLREVDLMREVSGGRKGTDCGPKTLFAV